MELIFAVRTALLSLAVFNGLSVIVHSQGLQPGGANVCARNVSQVVNVTVQTTRIVNEQYQTCCEEKWGTCISQCLQNRTKEVVATKQVEQTVYNLVYECCDGYVEDGDECKQDTVPCNPPCQNGQCTDTGICACSAGYEGDHCQTDIDECTDGSSGCAQNCANTDGSFTCSCQPGFTLAADGKLCDDIDECDGGSDSCQHNCVNNDGSYTCQCHPGYNLAADGSACQDIDECADGSSGCAQNCANTDGSYTCSCQPGFTLAADGKLCDDIDECSDGSHQCQQICTNNDGSYECSCNQHHVINGDGLTCRSKVQLNLVFVIQCSRMDKRERKAGINFAIEVLSRLPSEWNSRVAAIKLASDTKVIFDLGQYTTVGEMKSALLAIRGMGNIPQTTASLKQATDMLLTTSEGKKMIMFVGSGQTAPTTSAEGFHLTRAEALRAHDNDITIVSVANGKHVDVQGLLGMASYPKRDHMVWLQDGATAAAVKAMKVVTMHFAGVCVDPLVDLAVILGESCQCVPRKQSGILTSVGNALHKISTALSNDTAVAFFDRKLRYFIQRFAEIQLARQFKRQLIRLTYHRRRHLKCDESKWMKLQPAVQSIYNNYYNEDAGAIAKFKVLVMVTCDAKKEADMLTFTRRYPNEVLMSTNLVLDPNASDPGDSFAFPIANVDNMVSLLKQRRDEAQICLN